MTIRKKNSRPTAINGRRTTRRTERLQSVATTGAPSARSEDGSSPMFPGDPVEALDPSENDTSLLTGAPEAVQPRSKPGRRDLDDRARGSLLGRYLRDVAAYPMMKPEQELETAMEIARAEIAHWVAILSHLPAARTALDSLEQDLPSREEERLDLPQIAEIQRLLQAFEEQGQRLTQEQEEEYRISSESLASAIRLPDSDRQWIARAETAVRAVADASGEAGSALTDAIQQAALRSRTVKARFARANLRLVVSLARRYGHTRLPLMDLVQEGNIGLMKAVDRFDPVRGYRFSTYASFWIRHSINRSLADKGRVVRIPVHVLDLHTRIQRATQTAFARIGREPTSDELAVTTGITADKLEDARAAWTEGSCSLDRPVGDEDGRRFIDLLQDETTRAADDRLANQQCNAEVRRLLTTLTPIESRIIRWRFGLDDEEELTLQEIGHQHNLSRERIRQLQEQALGKLREQLQRWTG